MQPGDEITLFSGEGGECVAIITRMGRSDVGVRVTQHIDIERELAVRIHLWSGITANERMDWLLEKATELGACTLLPITAAGQALELVLLSGPEGGLSPDEEAQALAAGFLPVSLGQRVLRAETAPVAVLSALGLLTSIHSGV